MNGTNLTSDDIRRVLLGEAARMPVLTDQDQRMVSSAAERLPSQSRTLTASAVRRVLIAYSSKEVSERDAQSWASFVLRGYISNSNEAVRPVEIRFEPEREEDIVEALSMLDQLGETVDGVITDSELRELIQRLS